MAAGKLIAINAPGARMVPLGKVYGALPPSISSSFQPAKSATLEPALKSSIHSLVYITFGFAKNSLSRIPVG
jgi:hypothetical protein